MIDVGSPKVRWVEERDEYASQLVAYSTGDKQSFYDPIGNTIYIRYTDSVKVLLDETGHAKQFRARPINSYLRLISSMTYTLLAAQFDAQKAQQLYQARYRDPSTLEGEAHGQIKQQLLKRFGLNGVNKSVQ
jgi:hypothetical protein